MAIEDDAPRPRPHWEIGGDLSRYSLGDLAEYRAALEAEIARVDAETTRKRAAQGGAEALFKR